MPLSDEAAAALLAENAALKGKVALLEGEAKSRDAEIDRLRAGEVKKKQAPRLLDPAAGDRFNRPYDGR